MRVCEGSRIKDVELYKIFDECLLYLFGSEIVGVDEVVRKGFCKNIVRVKENEMK